MVANSLSRKHDNDELTLDSSFKSVGPPEMQRKSFNTFEYYLKKIKSFLNIIFFQIGLFNY